jgi:hypothetical protein
MRKVVASTPKKTSKSVVPKEAGPRYSWEIIAYVLDQAKKSLSLQDLEERAMKIKKATKGRYSGLAKDFEQKSGSVLYPAT